MATDDLNSGLTLGDGTSMSAEALGNVAESTNAFDDPAPITSPKPVALSPERRDALIDGAADSLTRKSDADRNRSYFEEARSLHEEAQQAFREAQAKGDTQGMERALRHIGISSGRMADEEFRVESDRLGFKRSMSDDQGRRLDGAITEQKKIVDYLDDLVTQGTENPAFIPPGQSLDDWKRNLQAERKALNQLVVGREAGRQRAAVEDPSFGGETFRGLTTGMLSTATETLGGALRQAGATSGIPALSDIGGDVRSFGKGLRQDTAAQSSGEVLKLGEKGAFFTELKNFVGAKLGEGIGTSVPIIAAAIAAGPAGGVATGMAMGIGQMRNSLEDAFAEEGIDFPEEKAAFYVYTYGSAIGALESAMEVMGVSRVMGAAKQTAMRSMARAIAKGAAQGAVMEGVTEALQELIEIAGVSQATDKPIDWTEARRRMIEGAAAGAVPGTAFGTVSSTAERKGALDAALKRAESLGFREGGEATTAPRSEKDESFRPVSDQGVETVRDVSPSLDPNVDPGRAGGIRVPRAPDPVIDEARAVIDGLAPAQPVAAAPAAPAQIPTFAQVLDVLPKDEAGDPDIGRMMEGLSEFGAKAWGGLTPEQKTTLFRRFAPVVEQAAAEAGPVVEKIAEAVASGDIAGAVQQAAEAISQSPYDQYRARRTQLQDAASEASKALQQFPRMPDGRRSDEVKFSPEFRAVKTAYDQAVAQLGALNKQNRDFDKQYQRDYVRERDERRAASIGAQPQPAAPVRTDSELRAAFDKVLSSKTKRSDWASAVGIEQSQLDTFINEALKDGRLKKTKAGAIVRTGKASASQPVPAASAAIPAAMTAQTTGQPAAASTMDRATEVRLERTKSKVARRYGQEIAEAPNTAAVKQAVERLNADPKIKKADLAEIVKVLIGRSAKGKTKAALIAEIEAVAGRRLAKKPAAAVAAPAPTPSAPAPVPAPAAPAPQAALTVVTPDGSMEVQATPQLVEITDLISASGTLQPRDRTRAEAMAAVREIATRLDPEQLLPARVSDTGAPIVAADGTVISGNGRIMALQEVYYNPALADRADAYRAAIGAGAQGMRAPVLIMRLPASMPRSELERFADLSNRSRIAAMSATERAIRDARAVGPEVMGLYNGGTFTSPANQEFFRSFTARLPASERGAFSRNGVLTKEGEDRMSAAVLASAYGDPDTLSRMLESTDDNIKSITGAMRDAAGAFIRLKASIAAGEASAKFDITPQVADTAKRIADLRDRGISPRMFLDQMDAFTQIDPIVESLLVAFYNDNLSRQLGREKLTEILVRYAEEAAKHKGDGLFEDTTSPRDIVTVARGRALESERLAAGQGNLFDRSPSPAGGAPAGDRGTGPGPANDGRGRDAGGQAAAAGGLTDAPSRDPGLERDWRDGPPQDGLGQADVPASGGPDAGGAGQGDAASATDGQADGGGSLLDGDAAPVGERGDSAVQGGAPGVDGSPAGGRGRERGGAAGVEGLPPDRVRPEALREAAANTARVTSDAEKQRAADDTIPFVANDLENIRESLPLLNAANQADVAKAEARFSQPDKFGFLFTNGTGTGKTFLGLGVIKRFEKQGKGNVLILAPSQGILDGWIKSGQMMNIDVTRLDDTKSAGEGVVATTYANLRDNSELVKRRWDLIIADEAHSLSQNQSGNPSDALQAFRGLTNHSPATRARLMLAPMWAEIERVEAGNKAFDTDQFGNVREMKDEYFRRLNELTDQYKAEPRTTRALFLSATPFAYRKSTDWAEGFLFDYPADSNRYGTPGGRDAFLVQNFGYNFRYNRAEEPGPEVNTAVLEREFYERMKREGALSGRRLEVDADYDRRFVLVDDAVGSKIDQAMDWLSTQDGGRYRPLYELFMQQFNYLSQRRLLEAIKAQHVIPRIRRDLDLGRKVVVFHDYNEGGGLNPFEAPPNPNERARVAYGEKAPTLGELYYEFIRANPYVKTLNFAQFDNPIETLTKAFGKRAAVYNGRVPNKQRAKARDEFNRDGSGLDVIIVQSAAGEAGISLHDTTGKHQRILYNLGLPTRPTTAIQQEGRIYREGQVSDAILRYMSTGTGWERRAFAQTIAERASTAENLALGEEARALRDGFIDAFNEADAIEQGPDEGKGSKARDRSRGSQVTPFERAKAFYFGQLRTKGRRDQREGVDYYATPEPIGFKMVEFADIRLGEKVLEPSAGHGAIARWFPEGANRVLIEPSSTLASRAGLSSPGANVIQGMFEDHYIGNKYDAIVMNPPFGSGGKDAFEHLQKAVGHLRSGGRIVAIVPRGGMADRRYETFRDADSNKNVYVALDVELPGVMFERAGTSVATRMIVLEKHDSPDTAPNPLYRDLSDAETITELFNRIEGLSLSERRRGGQAGRTVSPITDPQPTAPAVQAAPVPTVAAAPAVQPEQTPPAAPTPVPAPRTPALATFKLAETVHGKTGEDLFVASIATFVPRETYEKLRTIAKRHGGYYSTFRGRGAIPGFQFSDEDARAAFLQEVAGPKETAAPRPQSATPTPAMPSVGSPVRVRDLDPQAWDALKQALKDQQPFDSVEGMLALASVSHETLGDVGEAIAAATGASYKRAPLKRAERIIEKLKGRDPTMITDAARGGFDVGTVEQADEIVAALAERFAIVDEGWALTPAGYFDRKVMVLFENGIVGEVQMWPPGMLDAKGARGGHKLYEEARKPTTPEDRKKELERQMEALYAATLDQAGPDFQDLVLSLRSASPKSVEGNLVANSSRDISGASRHSAFSTSSASETSQGPLRPADRNTALSPLTMAGAPSQEKYLSSMSSSSTEDMGIRDDNVNGSQIDSAIRSADEVAKATRAYQFIRKQVLAGKRVPISGDVTNAFLDAAWPHSDLVPSGAQVAALSALRPPTAAEKVVSPWADVVGEFRSLDGTILTTALSLDKIDGYRGGYDRRNGAIVFFGLSRADVDGLTETVVRSRVAHEAVHAVWKSLPRSAKSRLVRHANVLGVLDMQLGTVLQAVGERRIGNRQEQETLRDLYAKQYAGDFDAKDRIDQESVAHMRELAAAGFFMDAELSAISADMALLDNVQEGVSPEERPMALQAAIQSSQDRASLADHFGATRIEDIGPNDPHPGRVLAFHGTGGAFDRLDPEKTSFGVHFGTGDQANYVIDAVDNRAPRRVYPAVIDIRNPVTLPDIGTWGEHQVALELQDIDPVRFGGLGDLVLKIWKDGNNSDYASDLAKETVRIAMEDAGYDAIRYYNRFEGEGWSYIVWEPGKVISATAGTPLFALSGGLPSDLDMSPEARKQRAEEMGFDTSRVWYHVTDRSFDKFSLRPKSRNTDTEALAVARAGIWMSNRPERVAERTGMSTDGGRTLPLYVRGDLYRAGTLSDVFELVKQKGWKARLRDDGYSGLIIDDEEFSRRYADIDREADAAYRAARQKEADLQKQANASWPPTPELRSKWMEAIAEAEAAAAEIAKLEDERNTKSVVIFDPSNIRSVNASFDPAQSDSSNLMFALSGGLPRDGEVDGARPSIDPGEIKRFLGKAEYDYQLSPAAVVEPDPYGGFSEMAANLPDDVNARFQVHGMTATQNMARGVAGDLIDLLENGIDPSRGFNSGPPKGGTFGVDTTRTNAPFLILSEPGKMIPETGVKYVVLNGPAAALKFKLSVAYPGVDFLTVTEADQFMRTGALPPKSTMQVGARQPTPPGIAKTAEAEADEGGASPSLNAVIQKLKESLNVVPTQTLLGVTIKAEDGSQVRLNPRKNVRGQMVASNAAVGVRKSRQIDVIAHEMAHTLEVTLGADILDFQQQNAAMLEAFAPGLTPSEQFADWFSYYITSGPGARAITPSLVGAFEDVIEANAPEMLEGIHEAQDLYADWLKRSTPDELASDVVSTYAGNSWTDLAGGDRTLTETIPGKMASAYTAVIDDLSPVQHMVRRLLKTADQNGVVDEAGRPISLAVADNPYKIARMFRGSYATGYSWLKSGIANRGETSIAFPGLSKALETLFGSSDQGAWDQTMYQTAGNYLIAKRAVAEYERMEEKESRLADIDSLIERGGAAGSQARSERGRLQAILERREDARLRSEALMRDRRTALQSAEREVSRLQERIQAKKDDVLAAQMAQDGALASRRQRDLANLERSSQAALRAASGLLEEFETLSTDVSLLSAEIAHRSEQIGAMDQQIAQIDTAVGNLRRERDATAKRGASRPPTKESKQHWLEVIAKTEADPKYARIKPFADEVHQFAHGLLTIRHQAGLVSDEQFQELSKRRNWYVPFQRDMSDASPETVFGGAATKKWSPFKKFDGSDRAIINPLETLASDAYATAQQIAFNDAVNALAGLAERAGPGSASIAQVLTREESAEANETTFQRIKDIALGMGLEEADADRIVHQMEQNFAGQELSLMWSPATKGPVNLPTVPLWRNGERVLVRLTDPEFGTEAFNALSGLGKEMSDWAINFLAVPARLLQMGITTHPTFLPRNLFRDIFDAWIKTGALPVVTQVKGARAMRDPEFLRRYYEAGGIVGGRNVAALTSKEQQYKVLDLSDNRISRGSIMLGAVGGGLLGTLYGGPIGGVIGAAVGGYALRKGEVLKAVEAVETMTRVGVATHAYKRAMEHNPDLTESEAMLEAAFVARDTFDWNRRGSKMLTLTRLVTFLNAQIQGMDAAARKLGGESDRGMMLSRHLGMVWRRENGATLSADEERMLGEAYKTWARVGLYTAGLVTLYALATSGDDEDDKKYQDIRDRTKATHSWLPNIFGVDVRLPKAFEWAVPANVIEAIADKVRGRDPRMWDRIVDSTYEVMAPPLVPQAMTLIVGLSTNAQMEQLAPWLKRLLGRDQENVPSRQVVAENLARLDPESQFDAFTSQLSIDIAKGMAASGVPRDLVPSPKKIDFILRSGGYWGQDIAKGYGIVREGLGFRGREAPRVSDIPVVAGFTGVAARQSKSRDELFGLMAQSGGRLATAAATYKQLIDEEGTPADAERFISRLDPEERVYALLKYYGAPQMIKDHPLERLLSVDRVLSRVRKDIILDRLTPVSKQGRKTVRDFEEKITLSPRKQTEIHEIIERLQQAEAWNTMVLMKRPGWEQKKEIATKPILDELKASDKRVHELFEDRLQSARAREFSDVKQDWPELRGRILRDGLNAF